METFVALVGAPKHSMTAVMSGTFTVEALDDHSDVIRWCLRPAWLKLAWASPRDFCLARCEREEMEESKGRIYDWELPYYTSCTMLVLIGVR